jgi:uncharacterized protein
MIDFLFNDNLAALDLGAPAPKPTSIDCEQWEAARELWRSQDRLMKIGVWECTPGRFSADRTAASETCHLIAGRITLHGADGQSRHLAAGDMLVLPRGWRGEWTIHETTRKLYVLHADGGA